MKSYIEKLNNVATSIINILIVDDRPENIIALEALLDHPSYQLYTASSGLEALRHVLSVNFAVILLDVQMPGMNGFETARLIKSRDKSKHVPILFITAISQAAENVKQGYSVGAIDYIFKPFHPDTLKMKIEAIVRMHLYQEQIKLQNELLSVIGDTSIDSIITISESGTIMNINRAAKQMFGYPPDGLIGRHIEELVPGIMIYWGEANYLHRIIETAAARHDGILFPVDIQIGEAHIDREKIYVCSIRDVTERKLVEEERYRRIFDAAPSLISLRSLRNKAYLNVNDSFLKATGYSMDEVLNGPGDILQYIMDDTTCMEGVEHTSGDKIPLRNIRISFMTKSGELREGLMSTEQILLHNERCLLTIITDITERLYLEQEMVRLDRLNLTGKMAAGIVHEIRNPMTTVRGYLQLSKNFSEEHTSIMIEELDRAHNLVSEFLSVTNINSTHRKLQSLNSVIETLFPLIQSKALCTNHAINLDLSPCPSLYLDEKEIRQLLLNLSINGFDAMNEGGILTIRTYTLNNEVVLEIIDQGTGIKDELLDKLGKPFFSTKLNGTGLGLSVSYGVAARHDAKIHVHSDDQGTVFAIHFKQRSMML
ncbi:PAS domain S-box protein [Paenibacillus sp. PR3]|uniref:histidine kinase n=1 Tax=Paenibacillus terricola TaxID=2763503 RepID=A0ABR8N466_9BACL|nr:PAS domain S-box protein [Paenibacillus terricola]MBD3922660.1 PAS domain S-box protein [Paenibacillus terricola]